METLFDRDHLHFLLDEVLKIERLLSYPRFQKLSSESFEQIIELAYQVARDKFAPSNRASDLNEPRIEAGKVKLIDGLVEGVRAYNEAGFCAALADEADGGLQLPFVIASVADAIFTAANPSTIAYPSLARAAANLLAEHASPEQKLRYMQPIVAGRWFGTMCLSEPQAGSSLADVSTRAEPLADGRYRISGAKMWISAGEHEIGENIVHLVLVRMLGASAGVHGISLMIVPRYRLADDGQLIDNDVRLAGLNHKMGQRGSVNTFLKFGERGDCIGELIGQPNQGLKLMFHMMNEERIAVGMGAVMVGAAGYYYALQYAKERKQGRLPGQKDPNSAPIPIIEHADVKRMLLEQKCVIEGMQLLGLYAATLVDDLRAPDTVKVHEADLKLELLTPVIKAWGSDRALEANALAIQILGGYGYTRDYPVEQCYRDNRINPIHEGTNGIQALDLLGRKIALEDGRALELLADEIRNTIVAASSVVTLSGMAEQLSQALTLTLSTLKSALHAMRAGGVLLTLANAEYAMRMMGTLCNAWCLLRMALAAPQSRHLSSAAQAGKLQCCTYFFEVHLPLIKHWSTLMVEEHACSLVMQAEWF